MSDCILARFILIVGVKPLLTFVKSRLSWSILMRKEWTRGHRPLHLTLMPFLHIKCSSYCLCPKDVMLGKAEGEVGYTHNNKCWYPLLLLVLISLMIIEISTWSNPTNEHQLWRLWPGKSNTGVKLLWQPAPTFFSLVLCFHPDFWNLGPNSLSMMGTTLWITQLY